MNCEILADELAVAQRGAEVIAAAARHAVAQRGRFFLAISGGKTPWIMLRRLAALELPWEATHLFQIDERIAPEGHADRNLTHLQESLKTAPLKPENIHAMPIDREDPAHAASEYAANLNALGGSPFILDLAHLGLGPDGHTASLIPGDPVLDVADRDVAATGIYQGRRRLTMTFPLLNRSRQIVWLITGAAKREMLKRVQKADPTIPGGRINQEHALVLADRAASG